MHVSDEPFLDLTYRIDSRVYPVCGGGHCFFRPLKLRCWYPWTIVLSPTTTAKL